MQIDAILSPLELPALGERDLRGTVCVVFDVLRATSSFVTALHHGAAAVIPVNEIAEAIAHRQQQPEVLLAGERDGVRIRAAQPGGVDFDFGNSPREFTPERVRGKSIVFTTTNGTRALRACANAKTVLAAAGLNLSATAAFLLQLAPPQMLLVCAGTAKDVALEDVLAAGALVDLLQSRNNTRPTLSDPANVALKTFSQTKSEWSEAFGDSQNGRRLLAMPDLREDVAFCSRRDVFDLVAVRQADGSFRKR